MEAGYWRANHFPFWIWNARAFGKETYSSYWVYNHYINYIVLSSILFLCSYISRYMIYILWLYLHVIMLLYLTMKTTILYNQTWGNWGSGPAISSGMFPAILCWLRLRLPQESCTRNDGQDSSPILIGKMLENIREISDGTMIKEILHWLIWKHTYHVLLHGFNYCIWGVAGFLPTLLLMEKNIAPPGMSNTL